MDTTNEASMDNSELLKQLIAEQQKTNRLLAQAQLDRERKAAEELRAEIAKREGVHPSMVAILDSNNRNIQVVAIRRDPRHAEPI